MADNSLNQVVLTALQQVSGSGGSTSTKGVLPDLLPVASDSFSSAITEASRQINTLTSSNQALIETVLANTQALAQSSPAKSSGSVGSTIGSVASTVFSSGLGLIPVISSLAGLLGGGKSDPPPSLLQYVAPPALQLDVANNAGAGLGPGNFSAVTYGQTGLPRSSDSTQNSGRSSGPQISIQVNAMDSRSFMDHSYDIARAVRQAMLDSHSLNDVVSDL